MDRLAKDPSKEALMRSKVFGICVFSSSRAKEDKLLRSFGIARGWDAVVDRFANAEVQEKLSPLWGRAAWQSVQAQHPTDRSWFAKKQLPAAWMAPA